MCTTAAVVSYLAVSVPCIMIAANVIHGQCCLQVSGHPWTVLQVSWGDLMSGGSHEGRPRTVLGHPCKLGLSLTNYYYYYYYDTHQQEVQGGGGGGGYSN